MIDRRLFLGGFAAWAATFCACASLGAEPVRIKKLGTFDIFIVEANPVVFKGKLWLMEYIRWERPDKRYRGNDTGKSYFRFRDMANMKTVTPPFGVGLHMGNAFVHNDRIYVTAVENWGKSRFYQLESDDMIHWTEPRVILENPEWAGYNTTMCRAGDRFILSFELGKPRELVGQAFTMFFAESKDLKTWTLVENAAMGRDRYTGAPMLRYHDGVFYYFHLEGGYAKGFETRVARSRDLKDWEFSPHVVLSYDPWDKMLHTSSDFTAEEKAYIAGAKNINASDLDMCEFDGKLVFFYSWGDQRGNEFSALAEADVTEREFCESFFKR